MPATPKNSLAFTLIELLLAIAVFGILVAMVIPSFSQLIKKQKLEQGAEQVKNDLRVAQNRALTGTQQDQYSGWGLKFVAGSSSYNFCGQTDSGCVVGSEMSNQDLPQGLVFRAISTDTFSFQIVTGEVLAGAGETIKIGYPEDSADQWKTITLTAGGNIE